MRIDRLNAQPGNEERFSMRSVKLTAGALQQRSFAQRLMPQKLWCQALLIQCLSMLLITSVAPSVINSVFAFELSRSGLHVDTIWFWLALHLLLVSVMARFMHMPVWWRWIHVIFPVAVLGMQQLALPAMVYFYGFLLTMSLYWSIYNTRVPFYPSRPATWRAMHYVLQQHAGERALKIVDIGSGIGDVSMFLSRQRPQDQLSGIEIAPLPWAISALRATLSGSQARFVLGDYRQLDFSEPDVVLAYLSPAVMQDVWQKVCAEMRPGSLLISAEFPVPEITATHIIYPSPTAPALFVYHL